MILITIFFTAKTSVFFTAVNFDNLIPQMAQVTVMAIGVVFVLLIGEIDLSIGYVSGLSAVVVAELQLSGSSHEYPWYIAIAGALLVGAVIGAIQGSIIAFVGVPSFVVTLAGLLAWERRDPADPGHAGRDRHPGAGRSTTSRITTSRTGSAGRWPPRSRFC